MQLYNTLSRKIDTISPIKPPVVTVYTCGPTVYDFPHIGNWFTFVRYDLLVRTLVHGGYNPQWVLNITDVGHLVSDADEGEDKLEKGARREHKTAWDVASYYTDYFIDGLARLNITRPTYLPRATEHIQEQIDLIRKLETKGFAYVITDGVYYDTAKFPRYADFAQLDIDEQQAGARVEYSPEKRNPTDFALWKLSPTDHQRDMEWDSPWGRGFPGWHIECSAMGMKYLGETLDIHAGGIDHVPVHHTNEIAQSEAVTGEPFAHIWMHANHITIEGEKISKSLGNGFTLEDIEAHDIDLMAFRLHVLESHYRSQSKFTWASLEAAQNRLRRWRQIADQRWQVVATESTRGNTGEDAVHDFDAALMSDLDTPRALAAIDRMMDAIEHEGMDPPYAKDFGDLLARINHVLGIDLLSDDLPAAQKLLITNREKARAAKDWDMSDKLRDQLAGLGVGINDTPRGTIWYHL